MAGALLAGGTGVTCLGAFGRPQLHPVFAGMGAGMRLISLCEPGRTTAVEFADGKIMLGLMKSLDEVTYERICEVMGETQLAAALAGADLVALVNWTMLPGATAIYRRLADRLLPRLPPRPRLFFFDLADPEKRNGDDLQAVLAVIARFEAFGRVTLGLNLREAQAVSSALGLAPAGGDEAGTRAMAAGIREKTGVTTVVIHPAESAACAAVVGTHWVPGPYVAQPFITTGAGDHFNAGFATGQLLGLSAEACLALGVCSSGHYVRTGRSPSLDDLETFLANGP
jgi:hypothetical protein